MSDLPKYSVLMSVYAKEEPEYLRLAMQSMWDQSEPPSEFVLVCDGPLGEALEAVVGKMAQDHPHELTIIRLSKNHGLGYALRIGLEACRFEYVARMDSDDISRPTRCEVLLREMLERDLGLVGGAIEEFNTVPGDMGLIRQTPCNQREIVEFSKRRSPFNHVSVMFRKDAISAVGGYQEFFLLEDYWLWIRAIVHGCKCGNVSDVLVDVRVGEGMYARRKSMKFLYSQAHLFSKMRKIGHITRWQQIRGTTERGAAVIIPTKLLKFAYKYLLRQ